ncbi:MAG: short chain dehydrogenase [Firmicutes bacterium ADurb.Bin182]|nr:MAG: short chain dehydrogenase [Firmicutes bacterium ADurb.Bin182]
MSCAFVDKNISDLTAYSDLSRKLGVRTDYVQGGGGNTSVKLDDRLMAIKASGYSLCDVTPSSGYAVLNYEDMSAFYMHANPASLSDAENEGAERTKAAVRSIDGLKEVRPSVEAGFHSILKKYVIHTHSVYANLACCALEGQRLIREALDGSDIPWGFVPYIDPGTKLAFAVFAEIERARREQGDVPRVLFLQNHGVIVHDDCEKACEALHERVNLLLAGRFGLTFADYPEDGRFLAGALAGGRFDDDYLLRRPLFPDQMVYLTGSLGESVHIDYKTGAVVCRQPENTARITMEILTAVVFIITNIEKHGFKVLTMGDAAKRFIAGWESEKYRKSIAGK